MSRPSLPIRESLQHSSSPLRRRSMLNRSGNESPMLNQNDDDAERKELRRNAELEMRQREVTPTSEKRRSLGSTIADLSAAQLAEHYANCIKLSAENKINAKNAFSLQLIDYMAMMLKKRDSAMDNFQVASCTLDASTKIYAYRVDCVHTDVLKMAGGLAVGTRKKQTKDGEEAEGHGEEPAEDAETVRTKRKRKARPTIAKNVETINGKLDLNHEMDPYFMQSAGSLGDCQPGDCHFLAGLKMCPSYALALDSSLPYWGRGTRSEFADMKVPLPAFPDFKNKALCPAFEEFMFTNWSLEKEIDTLTPPAAAGGLPPVDDDYVFDVNAPPEPIPEPAALDMEPENFEIAGIDDDQDSEDEEEIATACQVKPRRPVAVVDLRKHLSLTPREYSYFRAGALDLFAGPSHWKPKQYRGSSTEGQNKDGSAATAVIKQKKQKKELDFSNFREVLMKTEKSAGLTSRLNRQTLKKWSTDRICNPLDMFYDISRFSQLEFQKMVVVSLPNAEDEETEVDTPAYNYDNDNDAEEYCPNVIEEDDEDYCEEPVGPDGVPLPAPTLDVHNASAEMGTQEEFAGENLVAPPSKVSRVAIPYAMQAKKMDMKKLKSCIWDLVTDTDSGESPAESDKKLEEPKKFSAIYSELPSKLSPKLAENLSPHLAICALLHLANEKNLCITDQEDLSDLTISQF